MIGQRIRQARLQMGLSLDQTVQLLTQAGISLTKAALSKYERETSSPKASLLQVLGRVLNVTPEFFLREQEVTIRWRAYRRRLSLGVKDCERIQALAQDRVENFVWLRSALTKDRPKQFPSPVPVNTLEDAEHAAGQLREAWDLGDLPIESIVEVFEARDGILIELPLEDGEFDGLAGVVNDAYPVLVTHQDVSADRKRFTLAHELGHLMMETKGQPSTREEERLAHRFAAAFLVPREVATRELGQKRVRLSFAELLLLKEKYGLSMQAWLYRARDLGIIEEGHFNTMYVNLSAHGWRKEEPGKYKGREEATRFRQMVYRALTEDLIDRQQAIRWCPDLEDDGLHPSVRKETKQEFGPRTMYRLPSARRDLILKEAATAMADLYRSDSPVVVGDVFDDPACGERNNAK